MFSSFVRQEDYNKKKENMVEYKELFAALFKIPDNNLQIRVINAINKNNKYVSIGIQVDMEEKDEKINLNFDSMDNKKESVLNNGDNDKSESDSEDDSDLYNSSSNKKSKIISSGKEVKLGRTKKRKVPYAIKLDPNLSNNDKLERFSKRQKVIDTTKTEMANNELLNNDDKSPNNQNAIIKLIEDITDNGIDLETISLDSFSSFKVSDRKIREAMENDWNNCLTYYDGFLNIHIAIFDEDLNFLKRQCLALRARIGHINVFTDKEQLSALELALTTNCKIDIIEELLKYNIDIYKQNDEGNNALHLAILHADDINIIKLLIKNVPLEKLKILNDDGLSILHLAVKKNNIFIVKLIIEYIDKLLNLENFGVNLTDAKQLEDFLHNIVTSVKKKKFVYHTNEIRMSILDQKDRKSGRSPLFHALYENNELMTLYLLYNGCDPRLQSLSGSDPSLFAIENVDNKLIVYAINKLMNYYMQRAAKSEEIKKKKTVKEKKINQN